MDKSKVWGHTELARLYFPGILLKSASAQLSLWIRRDGHYLHIRFKRIQEFLRIPITSRHISNFLLLLQPCGGVLPVGQLLRYRLKIEFHLIFHIV